MKNHRRIAAAVAVLAMFVSAAPAMADRLQDILSRGKLIVGTGVGNPPWHFKDEQGNMAGFDVDIAKIIAKGLFGDDTKIEFVTQASDARVPNIVTDKVDVTCQFMTVTAARAPGELHSTLLSRGRRIAAHGWWEAQEL